MLFHHTFRPSLELAALETYAGPLARIAEHALWPQSRAFVPPFLGISSSQMVCPTTTKGSSHLRASGSKTAAQPQCKSRRLFVPAGSARSSKRQRKIGRSPTAWARAATVGRLPSGSLRRGVHCRLTPEPAATRLLLSCLLFRSSWLTVECGR
jgi:hypothetical protein